MCLGWGGFTGWAVDVVLSVVVGGGLVLSLDFILSTIAAALEPTPLAFASSFFGEPFTFDSSAISFFGVPSNDEPLSIVPKPPSIECLAV